MKAIQTEWHGCRFRSRLEARWAVVFEAMGIDWEYEPEGFVLDDGTWYLPDFLLHGIKGDNGHQYLSDRDTIETREGVDGDVWVEVKPGAPIKDADFKKIRSFARERPIIAVTQIPYGDTIDALIESVERLGGEKPYPFSTMIMEGYVEGGGSPLVIDVDGFAHIADMGSQDEVDRIDVESTMSAYAAGRSARFDHGENPDSLTELLEARRRIAYLRNPQSALYSPERLELLRQAIDSSRQPAELNTIARRSLFFNLSPGEHIVGFPAMNLMRHIEDWLWNEQLDLFWSQIETCKCQGVTTFGQWTELTEAMADKRTTLAPKFVEALCQFFAGQDDFDFLQEHKVFPSK